MQDAISYKRFSTRKQSKGDTDRRQADLAEQYCKSHHLRLIDTYRDAGLSGFSGQNLSDDGALRGLLQAAKSGKFRPGTRLIVESLDGSAGSKSQSRFACSSTSLIAAWSSLP